MVIVRAIGICLGISLGAGVSPAVAETNKALNQAPAGGRPADSAGQQSAGESEICHRVAVRVRAIKAMIDNKLGESSDQSQPIHLEGDIRDLKTQLEKLHFTSYRLLSTERQVMGMKRKETVNLPDGNLLSLRPIYVEKERVGLWIKWTDKSGADVLDTRMHFDSGESMVTGTESTGDTGLILAIDVKPESKLK